MIRHGQHHRPYRRLPHLVAAIGLAVALFGAPKHIMADEPAQAVEMTAENREGLQRIQAYLDSLTTVQARFTQTSDTGGFAQGEFYLSRPGRMRIEYDPPIPYLYVADGYWLTFWDAELGQRSDVALGSSLADFITREDIRLSGDVTVVGFEQDAAGMMVDLVQTDDPGAGQLTLAFDSDPLTLRSWTVLDAQGVSTLVSLSDIREGVSLDRRLFLAPRAGMPTIQR